MKKTTTRERQVTEMNPTRALQQINEQMDAVFVDNNNTPDYLPDYLNEIDGADVIGDPTRVITETEADGSVVLTVMEAGYRAGHYGTAYPVEVAEKLGY